MNGGRAPLLPEAFGDLEPFAPAWALPTEPERNRRRWASTPPELHAFHAAMSPRLDEAMRHLERYPLASMPADARCLFHLILSLVEVALALELLPRSAVLARVDDQRFGPLFGEPLQGLSVPAGRVVR